MNTLYRTIGISKQGFHQWLNRQLAVYEEQEHLLPILRQYREDHPRMSCRQMYYRLMPRTMGRDQFELFCYAHGFKVEIKRRKYRTTDSRGVIYFPNLLHQLAELTGINQLWVSDITYYEIGKQVYYLTFITDIYNREITGYSASKDLKTVSTTIPALRMAIRNRRIKQDSGLIFHSDGGGQYYSKMFVNMTSRYGICNSMGKTAYENPHAERVNGTIKNDYLIPYQPGDYQELTRMFKKAVDMYNRYKPHQSLGRHTPQEFRQLAERGLLTKTWVVNKKKKVTKKEKVNITIN